MIEVRLHGPLAEKYGAKHNLDVATPREAVWALVANHSDFHKDFLQTERWAFLVDGDWRHGDQALTFPCSKEVDICPVIEGRAFLGAMFIGFLIPSIAGTATASLLGGLLIAGLLLGVSLLFAPKAPKKPEADDHDKDDNYAFNGPDNITAQGTPVPIAYGRVHVGSVVVSAGLELDNQIFDVVTPPPPPVVVFPGGNPPIVQRTVGTKKVPGPAGWRYTGTQMIKPAGSTSYTTVYLFQSPSKVQPPLPLQYWLWDSKREFRPAGTGSIT